MNSRVLIKSFDYTKIQYDWIEVDFNTFAFDIGNSSIKGHSNNYNLSIVVTNKEYQRLKKQIKDKQELIFAIAN